MVPSQQQRRALPVAAIFGSATEKSLIQKQHIMKDAQQPRNLLIVETMMDAVMRAAEAVLVAEAEAVLVAEAEAVLGAEELLDDEIPKH